MTLGTNVITDVAKAAMVTAASPGIAQIDYGAAGSTIQYLLINTTGDAVAAATQRGFTLESSFNANELATANGYTVQGLAPGSQAVTVATNTVKVTTAAAAWTASGTLTAFGVWVVKHVGAAGSNPAVGYWSFGGSVSATNAALTVTPNAAGLFTLSGG